MLVLARKRHETIVIGNNIRVTVMQIEGGHQVRLGIDAPADVSVHRLEIWEEIQRKEQGREHSKEPWAVGQREGHYEIVQRPGRDLIAYTTCKCTECEANARRIVACINACRGISTEDLETKDVMANR